MYVSNINFCFERIESRALSRGAPNKSFNNFRVGFVVYNIAVVRVVVLVWRVGVPAHDECRVVFFLRDFFTALFHTHTLCMDACCHIAALSHKCTKLKSQSKLFFLSNKQSARSPIASSSVHKAYVFMLCACIFFLRRRSYTFLISFLYIPIYVYGLRVEYINKDTIKNNNNTKP